MGELAPGQTENFDNEIMPYISSCNVACGFHSGDPVTIEKTIRSAVAHKVVIGAHPSYDDRAHFGRKSMHVALDILIPQLRYQIYAVKGITESFGMSLHHVKAHGALYNDMLNDDALAEAYVRLVKSIDKNIFIYALAHSNVTDICKANNVKYVHEVFADRKYESVNQLRSRKHEDAVIHDKSILLNQVKGFLTSELHLEQGVASIKAESICLHSDTAGAVQLSADIYSFLKENNVTIAAAQ